jgi:hypothetical protein
LVNLDRRARPRDKEGERETERGRKADKRLHRKVEGKEKLIQSYKKIE